MIKVYTDAATKGNPGLSGIGIVIVGQDLHKQLALSCETHMTNHQAEFQAVILALEWLLEQQYQEEMIFFHSDSKIVVQTLIKHYTKNPDFLPLYHQIETLRKSFTFLDFKWIPESQNKGADHLARQGLQKIIQGGKKK